MELPEQSFFHYCLVLLFLLKFHLCGCKWSGDTQRCSYYRAVHVVRGRLAGRRHYCEQICSGEMGGKEKQSWRMEGEENQPEVSRVPAHLRPCQCPGQPCLGLWPCSRRILCQCLWPMLPATTMGISLVWDIYTWSHVDVQGLHRGRPVSCRLPH